MDSSNGGWIAAAIMAGIGTLKYLYDYLKKKSDNETAIKLNEQKEDEHSKDSLKKQNELLLAKLDEVEDKLEHTEKKLNELLLAFEIVFPIMNQMIEDNPTYKPVFENAFKHFKNK